MHTHMHFTPHAITALQGSNGGETPTNARTHAARVRMSRTELTLRSPLPPTASQVMTTDIASGIIETKTLDVLAACCNGLLRALIVADGNWLALSTVVWWRSMIIFPWHLWHGSPSIQR